MTDIINPGDWTDRKLSCWAKVSSFVLAAPQSDSLVQTGELLVLQMKSCYCLCVWISWILLGFLYLFLSQLFKDINCFFTGISKETLFIVYKKGHGKPTIGLRNCEYNFFKHEYKNFIQKPGSSLIQHVEVNTFEQRYFPILSQVNLTWLKHVFRCVSPWVQAPALEVGREGEREREREN